MASIEIYLVIIFLLYLCYYTKERLHFRGPWPFPLIGNLPQLGKKMHISFNSYSQTFGNVFWISILHKPVVVINGNAALREAFAKKAIAFAGRPVMNSTKDIIKGHSLAFSDYSPTWKIQKKFAGQGVYLYNIECVQHLESSISKRSKELVTYFQQTESVDPQQYINTFINDTTFDFLFDEIATEKRRTRIRQVMGEIMSLQSIILFTDLLPIFGIFFKKSLKKYDKCTLEVDAIFRDMVYDAETNYKQDDIRTLTDAFVSCSKKTGKYGLPDGFDHYFLLDVTQDMYGAALDTTRSTLLHAIRYMAVYPEVQKQIQTELDHVNDLTWERVNRVPYLLATLTEINRHASTLPLTIPHKTTQDVTLMGQFIPKDTMVFGNLYSANREQSTWGSDADSFNPSRFILDDGSFNEKLSTKVQSFGLGSRRCLGEVIARKLLGLAFAEILQTCTIREDPLHPINNADDLAISLIPVPYRVHFLKR